MTKKKFQELKNIAKNPLASEVGRILAHYENDPKELYLRGVEDGQILMAREVLDMLGKDWKNHEYN